MNSGHSTHVRRAGSQLMNLGVIVFLTGPGRIATYKREFTHPGSGQKITLIPLPTLARPQFWENHLYHLHENYGHVVYEDGWHPYCTGTLPFRSLLAKYFLPILPRCYEINTNELRNYIGSTNRDVVESAMAFRSTESTLDPPVDPRARRGLERIRTLPTNVHAVLPWNVYHQYYLMHKLRELGYVQGRIDEIIIFTQQEVLLLTAVLLLSVLFVPFYLFRKVFSSKS